MAAPKPQSHIAHELLSRAHSPDTADQLFTEKVKQKPLFLRPTSPSAADNRERRRLHRLRKKEYFLRKQKPKPLSACEKRSSGIYDLPKKEIKYEVFKGLHKMWIDYMQEILDMKRGPSQHNITALSHGAKLSSADFHGAELQIVRSRCVSRVGLKGIVVRDSKFTFVLVTEKDKVLTVPKEHTVFRFEIPFPLANENEQDPAKETKNMVFELHGSQFENRPVDRANKRIKWKNLDYL